MSYVEGFVVAVPAANKEEYRKHATDAAPGRMLAYIRPGFVVQMSRFQEIGGLSATLPIPVSATAAAARCSARSATHSAMSWSSASTRASVQLAK